MKSRSAVRIAVFVNILSQIALVFALARLVMNLMAAYSRAGNEDMSPSVVATGSVKAIPTFFIIFALVSFFIARKTPSVFNIVLVVVNVLMALFTLIITISFWISKP